MLEVQVAPSPWEDMTSTSNTGSSWWWLAASCTEIYTQTTVHLKTQLFIKIQLNMKLLYIHPPVFLHVTSCPLPVIFLHNCLHKPAAFTCPFFTACLPVYHSLLASASLSTCKPLTSCSSVSLLLPACLPLLNYIPDCVHLPPWLSYPIFFAGLTASVCLLVSALLLPSLPVLLLPACWRLLPPFSHPRQCLRTCHQALPLPGSLYLLTTYYVPCVSSQALPVHCGLFVLFPMPHVSPPRHCH
jgi:hypothetical protein